MFKLPERIKNEIPEYGETLRRFIAGELSAARVAGVRVPWGNYSQRGGNIFMARIRVPAGILTPRQLKALAFCARQFGNGTLHLTTRQDIQIHDVAAANIIKVHDYLKDFDLSSRGGGGNTVRNITACYRAGVCPDEAFDVSADATAATEQLIVQDTSFTLPRKFKVAFSGCSKDCARCMVNDVGLLATPRNGASGYRVFVGGGMGARSIVGKELEEFVPGEQISCVLNAIKNVFHNHGDRKNKHRNRLRFLVAEMGLERFKALYQEEFARLKASGQFVSVPDPSAALPRSVIGPHVLPHRDPLPPGEGQGENTSNKCARSAPEPTPAPLPGGDQTMAAREAAPLLGGVGGGWVQEQGEGIAGYPTAASLRATAARCDLESPENPLEEPDAGFRAFLASNVIRQKQPGFVAVHLRIPRGDLGWPQAEALADLADEFKEVEFRATQDQDLCLVNIRAAGLKKLYARLKDALEHFLYPATLLDVAACKGSRTCNLGLCNSPGLAEALERVIEANFVGKKVFAKVNIRINGCPNGCSQHPLGAMAFVGAVRRCEGRPVPHYKLLLGGRAGVPDTRLAKETGILLPARNLPAFVKEFLERIESEIADQENVHEFLDRRGQALADEIKSKYERVPPYAENRDCYIDWGGTEEFSMKGLGPGECGAGVVDMVESDLADAATALLRAGESCDAAEVQKALFYSARALLVVRGSDPKRPEEAYLDFLQKLIGPGIASAEFANLSDVHESLSGIPDAAARRTAFAYAQALLEHVKDLYKRMDPSFNFPAADPGKPEPIRNRTQRAGP
ncbi:MAG: nitrite/sulfite reductase [Verrucomicrobia bacterium]|nr:nitrite/sulfite reductase [Verrucomicrobiota bacterium]